MFRYRPISFTQVEIRDAFWSERQRVNHERSLPKQYDLCSRTGRFDALRLRWRPGSDLPKPHIFWDSDTAKWLEAACYACQLRPDAALRQKIDEVAALFVAAQQPDGYLNSHFTVVRPEERWTNLRDDHELYCAGHFIEAAVAHHILTGGGVLLNAARRLADLIADRFGTAPGQMPGYCGHEEIELALVRLYRATGERRYLDLASYFVDQRGQSPAFFAEEEKLRGGLATARSNLASQQAHQPVRDQREVVGHAVRAMYLYCGMTDLADLTEDDTLLQACRHLWRNLTRCKLYITGGIGSTWENEAFTSNYDLPNERAYCETCASVALVFWSHRMLQDAGDGDCAAVMERALYNGALSGMSLDGEKFFYQNPLASLGKHHRQEWFECACCPSNLSRLLGTLGSHLASTGPDSLLLHLYIGGKFAFALDNGVRGRISLITDLPWSGCTRLVLALNSSSAPEPSGTVLWRLLLRIPDWSRAFRISVNGKEPVWSTERGYACIERVWCDGDTVEITMELPILRLVSDPRVVSNAGQTALQRGPFVYCIEDADFEAGALSATLPHDAELAARHISDLLGGVTVLEGLVSVAKAHATDPADALYRPVCERVMRSIPFRAIPYFAWDNRQPGAMRVWIPIA